MKLADFLQAAARDRSPWNCSTLPADWCIALGYPDFAAAWRGVVDPADCDEVASDGLVDLWVHGIAGDLEPASDPYRMGDVGIIARAGLEAGAIFDGAMWVLRREGGLSFVRLPDDAIAKAWRP